MPEAPTAVRPAPTTPSETGSDIEPRRSLPGGRAVVGAFLVVLAAVGTFGAYLQATAAPSTSYLAATGPVEVGRVLTTDDVQRFFEPVAVELPEEQAARTVRASQVDGLVGTVVVAPVTEGDLLLVSSVQPVGTAEAGVQLSLAVPPERAVGGDVAVGERVDVIATFPGRGDVGTVTRVVARQVAVVATPDDGDGLGGGRVVLTVRVPDLATAQSLQYAADVAEIAILRGADAEAADPAPELGASWDPAGPAPVGAGNEAGGDASDPRADTSGLGGDS